MHSAPFPRKTKSIGCGFNFLFLFCVFFLVRRVHFSQQCYPSCPIVKSQILRSGAGPGICGRGNPFNFNPGHACRGAAEVGLSGIGVFGVIVA